MPDDIVAPVERVVTVTEERGLTLRCLTMRPGSADETAMISIELAPYDDNGNWLEGAVPKVVQREGDEATAFIQMILDALVQPGPVAGAYGVAGLSNWDAAKEIVPQLLSS